MGQLPEKAKLKLKEIGIQQLPIQYKLNEQQAFGSQNSMIKLIAYSVLLNPNEIDPYFQNLKFRKENAQFLIQVHYAEVKKYNTDYCKLMVYIQHMALNLQQILSISFDEMIKIIYFSLKGFKLLFQKYGYFGIEPVMIGINDINEVKVWLNRKYNQYSPKTSYSYSKLSNAEGSMVNEIKDIFNSKTDKDTIVNNFSLEHQTFEGLIYQIQAKFGKQNLVNKVQISLNSLQNQSKSLASTISPTTQNKNKPTGPKIRFNYRSIQNQTVLKRLSNTTSQKTLNSNIMTSGMTPKITINGRSVSVSVQKRTIRSASIKNIKFNYTSPQQDMSSPIKRILESNFHENQTIVEK